MPKRKISEIVTSAVRWSFVAALPQIKIVMYTTDIFETAINSCGYTIIEIKYVNKNEVHKVEGTVPIPKKVTIDGKRQTVIHEKKVRWDANGSCFSLRSNIRQRDFDLPLSTIAEWKKLEREKQNLA